MASPFPGMDPYLEGEMWQEFHERLAHQISVHLMPALSPKYVALLAKRYVINRPALGLFAMPPERVIYPDVHVLDTNTSPTSTLTTATSTITQPAVELANETEIPILSVEIKDVAQRRLVTAIEILSPVNKQGEGFREYTAKRRDILRTQTHLLEIDLLRQGHRLPLIGQLPPAHYYVYLSHTQRRPYTQVWPISLRDPLPTVPVPLLEPDLDATLNLQTVLDNCFKLVGYERLLDYKTLLTGLNDDDAAWVAEQINLA